MSWLDRLICPVLEFVDLFGATMVVGALLAFFFAALGVTRLKKALGKLLPKGVASPSPAKVASILILLGTYGFACLVDPLLKSTLRRPTSIDLEQWERIGFFEWKFIGGDWSASILPLVDHPAIGFSLHAVFWYAAFQLVRTLLLWLHRDQPVKWDTPQVELPWYYRWVGSSTARRADGRFSAWVAPLLLVLVPLHGLSGYLTAAEADARFMSEGVVCGPDEPEASDPASAEGADAIEDPPSSDDGATSGDEGGQTGEEDGAESQTLSQLEQLAEQFGIPFNPDQLPPELRDVLDNGDPEDVRRELEEAVRGQGLEIPEGLDVPRDIDPAQLPGLLSSLSDRLLGGPIEGAPFPGAWILFGLLFLGLSIHLIEESAAPEAKKEKEEEEEELEPEVALDPLRRLGDALRAKVPGAFLEALENLPAVEGARAPFPEGTSPLVKEAFEIATGGTEPWAHQVEVLEHLSAAWKMAGTAELKDAPILEEQLGPSPIRSSSGPPHALVLGAEGSGRTTLTGLASIHVHLDRGATTLVVTKDAEQASRWANTLRHTLERSSARWNVFVTVAGDDLGSALLSKRTPNVVVAGLEDLESQVLLNSRTDGFFKKLGLVVADDVDQFTGVREMHLQMTMRRLWALVDRVHDAPYPVALLATAGPSASGIEAWARHVLSAPLRIFDRNTAPRCARTVLRRRDLADAQGEAIPLHVLAEACDAAELPWHMRRAGDAHRSVGRPETQLGKLRRHHQTDPRKAEVVLLEGTYPDVKREAARLAHAGQETEARTAVMILAAPADEEMVLHEEATDAAHRELVDALPRSVNLTEPEIVRQRHLDRALGREQDVEALKQRFGRELISEMLERLTEGGRVRFRRVWYFDPATDAAVGRDLVRAGAEIALGEPIEATCVSDAEARVAMVDRGTAETLAFADRAIADALYPPGSVFLHPQGRFRVVGVGESELQRECEEISESIRTTPDREVRLERTRVSWTDRDLGGLPVAASMVRAQIKEVFTGLRAFAPGPRPVEHRHYSTPVEAAFTTDVCLVGGFSRGDLPELTRESLVPIAASVRMMLPCYLRGSENLVGTAVVNTEEGPALIVFDRTPGGSGFARYIHERGLGEILRLARLTLERLVGPQFARLRRIHDLSTLDQEAWNVPAALDWLDRVLDKSPELGRDAAEKVRGRRVVFTPGEGYGDLGRLWISSTGRTDDLVWTRHSWRSKHPIANSPAGDVFIDVAVERRTIAHAVRQAVNRGAAKTPREITNADEWVKEHRAALSTSDVDLVALIDRLRGLAGDHYVDAALGLVAEIPTHKSRLSVADRAPLAVLARRRADRDAKILLAWAMLPSEYQPKIKLTDEGPTLEVVREGTPITVDLSGAGIRILDHAGGEPLSLDTGDPE